MKVYALYCNGNFVAAKPFYTAPKIPQDFGVGGLPTSCYEIFKVFVEYEFKDRLVKIDATIDVGSRGVMGNPIRE